MKTTAKTFAFRLANRDDAPRAPWKARKGAALAQVSSGCSKVNLGNYRYTAVNGTPDAGYYC
jgi:hypothetical protein